MEVDAGAVQAPLGHYWNLAKAYLHNQLTGLCHQHGLSVRPTSDVLAFILRILPAIMTKYGLTPETAEDDQKMATIEDDPFQAIEDLVKYFHAVVSGDIIGNRVLPAEWLYNALCRWVNIADTTRPTLDWREIDDILQITVGTTTLGRNFRFQHIYSLLAEQQVTINDRACEKDLKDFFQAIYTRDVPLEQMLTLINKPFFKAVTPQLEQLIENYVHFLLIRKKSPAMKQIAKNDLTKQCIAQAQLDVIVKMFGETGFTAMLKDGVLETFGSLPLVPAFVLFTKRECTETQQRFPEDHYRDAGDYAMHFWNSRFIDPLVRNPYNKQSTRPDMKSDWMPNDKTVIFWEDSQFYICDVVGAGTWDGYFNVIDSNGSSFPMHPTQMYMPKQFHRLQQEIWNFEFPCGTFVKFKDGPTKGQVVSAFNPNILTVRSQDGNRFEKHKDSLEIIKNAIRMDNVEGSFQLQETVHFSSSNGARLKGTISSIFHDKDGNVLAYEVLEHKKYYVRLGPELTPSGKRSRAAARGAKESVGIRASGASSAQEASSEAASVASSQSVASVQGARPARRSATTVQYRVGQEVEITHHGQRVRGVIQEMVPWYNIQLVDDDGEPFTLMCKHDEVSKV
jgi:hypothetical protein